MKLVLENFGVDVNGLHDNMSDEEFFNFCRQNADLKIERDEKPPNLYHSTYGIITGKFNTDIVTELNLWSRKTKTGIVFDSSTGFTLPDGSVFYPDASWVDNKKIVLLTEEQKKEFAPVCPDFIVELKSPSDGLKKLKAKMLKWIENGAQLAWLIDPEAKQVFIYREDGSIAVVQGFDNKLSGENVLPDFELDLKILQ